MDPDDWQPLLDALLLLKNDWPETAWGWDTRFTMMTSSFKAEVASQARATAAKAMQYAWDTTTIGTAPKTLQEICNKTGGLRKGQYIMAGKAGPIVLVGLWWPWSGGQQITLRLGLGEYEAMEDPYPKVRELFGARMT